MLKMRIEDWWLKKILTICKIENVKKYNFHIIILKTLIIIISYIVILETLKIIISYIVILETLKIIISCIVILNQIT